ncbi:MAG: HlyC/CorC family transporter [Verrucomicrobia bacterium]|nr:HlyC/CorC family transporter [Verrucomicrobiota bacterium]
MTEWILPMLGLLALLALSAFFSGTETALFSLGRIQTRRLTEQSPALGAIVTELLGMPRRLLSTILLGNTLVNTTATAVMFWLLLRHHSPAMAGLLAVVIMVPLLVTVGELGPKLLAILNPARVVRLTAKPIRDIARAVGPLLIVSHELSQWLNRVLVPASAKPAAGLSEDEVRTLLEVSMQEGVLRGAEKNMIQEILRLRRHTAKDLLTPRVDMIGVAATMPKPELVAFLKQCGHRRVPVYDETPDTIVGILDVKKFLLAPDEAVVELMDPPSFVPETMNAVKLLKGFQTHKRPMAVVVDEFGGTEGLLTMTDILEEIVGDLAGEFRAPEQDIQLIRDNVWLVAGDVRLDELNDALGLRLASRGVDTLGGLVATQLGGFPRPGATVRLHGVEVSVERVVKNRIIQVRLERRPEGAP